ncbi:MAG: pentapeptide repeat-containing protein [Planctomycetota bacterium]
MKTREKCFLGGCSNEAISIPDPIACELEGGLCFHHLHEKYGGEGIKRWFQHFIVLAETHGKLEDLDWVNAKVVGSQIENETYIFPPRTVFRVYFGGASLSHVDFPNAVFKPTLNHDNDQPKAEPLQGARFDDCKFEGAEFRIGELRDVVFDHCDLTKTRWPGLENGDGWTDAHGCSLSNVKFVDSDIGKLRISGIRLQNIDFTGAKIDELHVIGGQWENVDFSLVTSLSPHQLSVSGGLVIGDGCKLPAGFQTHIDALVETGAIERKGEIEWVDVESPCEPIEENGSDLADSRIDLPAEFPTGASEQQVTRLIKKALHHSQELSRLPSSWQTVWDIGDAAVACATLGLVATAIAAILGSQYVGLFGGAAFIVAFLTRILVSRQANATE